MIEADHRLREHVIEERSVDALQSMCEGIGEIPQRLRCDHQAVPLHDPRLPLERNVVEVLVEHDLDRKRERIAAPRRGALGTGRGLDAAAAPAHVLLLLDLDDAVGDLDDVDHLGRLDLALHLEQFAAAAGAHAIGGVELEALRHVRQIGLRCRTRVIGRLLGRLRRADLLRLVGELVGLFHEVVDHRERLLQLVLVAGVERQRVALLLELTDQLLDLRVLRQRDPTKLLDVLLALEIRFENRHAFF